uniref:NADH dehydrogenase [ubiquinone] 1 beta subcomplex subunit 7 n=1 Tax=Ditylenchus dipsaci TaxID=166011 RepID=A0A915CWB0_9BILA
MSGVVSERLKDAHLLVKAKNHIRLATSWEDYRHPEIAPRVDRPPTFDPLAGFPNGRKKREMVATVEEMDRWQLDAHSRDYCAHKLIKWMQCMKENNPVANYYCDHDKHDYYKCNYEDYIMRMKEYEREKRLLARKVRKEKAAAASLSEELSA